MRNVFVSIINFNGRDNTLACLDSIKKLNTSNFKLNVVVIDNGSNGKLNLSQDYLRNIPLKLIAEEKNLGFTGGQNKGIKYALEKDLLNSSINGLCLIVTHSVVSFLTLYRKRRALEEDL